MGRVRCLYALENSKINNQGIISKVSLEKATFLKRHQLMLLHTSLVIAKYMILHSQEANHIKRIFDEIKKTAKSRINWEVLN